MFTTSAEICQALVGTWEQEWMIAVSAWKYVPLLLMLNHIVKLCEISNSRAFISEDEKITETTYVGTKIEPVFMFVISHDYLVHGILG